MSEVDVAEAKHQLDQLLERVSDGEEILITKDQQVIARLVAPSGPEKKKRTFGSLEGDIWMSDDFDEPLDDFRDYM